MHLDDRLSDRCGREEGAEGDAEVPAGDAGQVEEWVGDGSAGEDGPETVFLHVVVDDDLCSFHEGRVRLALQLQNFLYLFAGKVMLLLLRLD